MKYTPSNDVIPHDIRKSINEKCLYSIHNDTGITQEDIFNAYTGIGGLHGLTYSDYGSYTEFSEAKKEIENGQFFTPHNICESISLLITPTDYDIIGDITCGIGNFFNYFKEENCFGCELEQDSYNISKHLYPKADITNQDFRFYKPYIKFDYILGNPPFNIRFRHPTKSIDISSQMYFFEKSYELLKEGSIIIAIVPLSFLNDEFSNGSDIQSINDMFDFVGQYVLDKGAFSNVGVTNYATKVLCLQKKSKFVKSKIFDVNEFVTYDELKSKIIERQGLVKEAKLKIHRANNEDKDNLLFDYKVKKYFYEIKTHEKINKYYVKARTYYDKYLNQECPSDMPYIDWYKKHRITDKMVISYLKRTIAKQDKKVNINNIPLKSDITSAIVSESYDKGEFNKESIKLIDKKRNKYKLQSKSLINLPINEDIDKWLRNFYFINVKGEKCYYNELQLGDINRICQKDYGILAWQMGGGKTGAAYAWSKYKKMKTTFIVSTSMAINMTWSNFLETNNESYVIVKTLSDIDKIKDVDYVLLSFHYLSKNKQNPLRDSRKITQFKTQLIRTMRKLSNKVNFIFDESDEITNNKSNKTKNVIAIFRRAKRKLLTTGTTTRNNISELYSQLELLYNNSYNMICEANKYYLTSMEKATKGQLLYRDNPYYNIPFSAKHGQLTFRRCFNPSKNTVFGIEKQDQRIYNEEHLRKIIDKTIITRKFREIAGDKYTVSNIQVRQSYDERQVYKTIIEELYTILPRYFNSTGNSRKDSMLRIIRQLSLLIEATSTPHLFDFFGGNDIPNKAKKIFDIVSKTNEKIAIGCTSLNAVNWYKNELVRRFSDRMVFDITGEISFDRREKIIKEFETTYNGILISTQQSLKSSVNIPTCNKVIIESMQWNMPKIEQFFFRFIRYDSKENTEVIFINYENTIEINLLSLLMAKERLNDYIKTLDSDNEDSILESYGIDSAVLDSIITKEIDSEGKVHIKWGDGGIE